MTGIFIIDKRRICAATFVFLWDFRPERQSSVNDDQLCLNVNGINNKLEESGAVMQSAADIRERQEV